MQNIFFSTLCQFGKLTVVLKKALLHVCLQNRNQPRHADPETALRRRDSPWVSLAIGSARWNGSFSDTHFLTHAPFGAALMCCLWQKVSYASFLIFLAEDIQLLCVHRENIERRKWSSTGESESPFPPPAAHWQHYEGRGNLEITIYLGLLWPPLKCPAHQITHLHLYSSPFIVRWADYVFESFALPWKGSPSTLCGFIP